MALYGTVLGAFGAGLPADRLGRKTTLFWIGILYFISAMGSAFAPEMYSFMIFRFIGGVGVGASSVVGPIYISEISPPQSRGKLVALFQFNVIFGILMAYLSNYFISDIGPHAWRWMLGVEALPSLVFAVLALFISRSPRWLVYKKNAIDEARSVLQKIGSGDTESELKAIQDSIQSKGHLVKDNLFARKYRFPVMLAFMIAFFNQMAGINAVLYYAPRIFEMTGLGARSALLSTTGVGLAFLVTTVLALMIIDRFGRRTLMLVGSMGLILTLGLVAWAFFTENYGGVPIFIFLYVGFFGFSQGTVIWVFISEIFPNHIRGQGQSLGSFTHWLMTALIANTFPFMANTFGGGSVFLFFAGMMIFQLIWVLTMMPETKGMSLEDLEGQLIKKE